MKFLSRLRRFFNECLPTFTKTALAVFALCALTNIIAVISAPFADFVNFYISSPLRAVFAHLTGWIPFSLAETVVLFMPVMVVALFYSCIKRLRENGEATRFVAVFFGVTLLVYSAYFITSGVACRTSPIEDKLSLSRCDVSTSELEAVAGELAEELCDICDEVDFSYMGFSNMPYDLSELVHKLCDSYDEMSNEYTFLPRLRVAVKPIMLSVPMTYTHISGIYTFFTGEANINTNFPDYTLPYTVAHEMAHQRGVIREDEANFIAFLTCFESDDAYIRYSGLLGLYEYVASALYSADPDSYAELVSKLDLRIRYELVAYSEFYSAYRDSAAADISNSVNDFYLKAQGQTAGTRSYGQVVDLAVAYYKKGGIIQ